MFYVKISQIDVQALSQGRYFSYIQYSNGSNLNEPSASLKSNGLPCLALLRERRRETERFDWKRKSDSGGGITSQIRHRNRSNRTNKRLLIRIKYDLKNDDGFIVDSINNYEIILQEASLGRGGNCHDRDNTQSTVPQSRDVENLNNKKKKKEIM